MKIKKIADLETALAEIASLDNAINQIDTESAEIINKAKADAEAKSRALIEKRADLIIAMKEFSDSHRDEVFIDGKKSRDFVNGTIGYRQLPDTVEVTEETAQLLCDAGFEHCVKVKKEPVKAALKNFSSEQMQKFQIKLLPGKESFYAKASEITIPKPAA